MSSSQASVASGSPAPERAAEPVAGPPLDPAGFAADVHYLASRDPELGRLVDRWGAPQLWSRPPGFATLVLFVLEQQVSLASARAVYDRLDAGVGGISPTAVAGAPAELLRGVGVTRQKTGYLHGLAEAVLSGVLDLPALADLADDEVRRRLTAHRGIGTWTADVYLLACLLRRDVWPVGDRALQVAAGSALGLPQAPDAAALTAIGERWRPCRSAATRLLWHAYLAGGRPPRPPGAAAPGSASRRDAGVQERPEALPQRGD